MVMPHKAYEDAMRRARFHVQVEVTELDPPQAWGLPEPLRPKRLHFLAGRVVRVFRTDGSLATGDSVIIQVPVVPAGEEPLVDVEGQIDESAIAGLRFFEAYFDGDPPQLEIAAGLWRPLAGVTNNPLITKG